MTDQSTISDAEVMAAAKVLAAAPTIDAPSGLDWPCWAGTARSVLRAAAAVRRECGCLPMASDTLRHEGRVIREAAERAETQMLLCQSAVQDAHKIVKAAKRLAERSADFIYTDAVGNRFQKVFSDDLAELKSAIASSANPT